MEEPDDIPSIFRSQSYYTSYADEFVNYREHGHAGEVWFGTDVMDMVASWTKGLCVDISQKQVENHHDDRYNSRHGSEGDRDLAT